MDGTEREEPGPPRIPDSRGPAAPDGGAPRPLALEEAKGGGRDRNAFLLAVAAAALVSFTGILNHDLRFPDEPRVAEIGREMFASGDYLVPTLNGVKFLEKPPLGWWVMAASYGLLGVSDGAARLPGALAAFLTLLLAWAMAAHVGGPRAGLLALLVTSTFIAFWNTAHTCILDPWIVLFVSLGYFGFQRAAFPAQGDGRGGAGPGAAWVMVVYLAGGLAFLAKGPVGVVLLAGPIVIVAALFRDFGLWRSWAHLPGALLFLALCGLWPFLLHLRGEGLLATYFQHNILYRIYTVEGAEYRGGHVRPFWYYLVASPVVLLPWLFALPAVYAWIARGGREPGSNRRALLFLTYVFPLGLLLLSLPSTKRSLYILPLVPTLGAIVGAWFSATGGKDGATLLDRATKLVFLALLPVAVISALVVLVVADRSASFPGYPSDVPFRVSGAVLAILGLLALAVVGVSVKGFFLWKNRSSGLEPLVLWSGFCFLLAMNVVGFRLLDPLQNPHAMTRDIRELSAGGPDVMGFKLDEFPQSILAFDTGGVPNMEEDSELLDYVLRNPGGTILTFQRFVEAQEPSLRNRLEKLKSWRFGDRREYSLYRIRK